MALELTGSIDALGGFTASQEFVGTASYATTASFALNAGGGGATISTASLLTTSSISGITQSFTKGDGSTYTNIITNATTASFVEGASGGINFKTGFSGQLSASLGGIVEFAGQNGLYTQVSGDEIRIGVLSNADLDVQTVDVNQAILDPQNPLPASPDSGALAVSGSPANLYVFDGTNWNEIALNANVSGSFVTGSFMTTGSVADSVLTFTKGDGSTFDMQVQTGSSIAFVNAATASLFDNAAVLAGREEDTIRFTNGDGTTTDVTLTTSSFVKSVNTLTPNAQGNVAVAFGSVETGTSASMLAYSSSGNFNDSDIWVISGESGSLSGSNGDSFIFASASGKLLEISPTDQVSNDARYTLKAGDTMTGPLVLNADPTVALGAETKEYGDTHIETASAASNVVTFTKGDGSTFNVTVGTVLDTGSLLLSASVSSTTMSFTKGDSTTFDVTITESISASFATSSSLAQDAISSSYAVSASNTQTAVSSSKVDRYSALSDLTEHGDDDEAADGGVPIGGLYRNGNFVLIRIGGVGTDTHYLSGFSNTNFIDFNGGLSGCLDSSGPWSFGYRSVGNIADSTDLLATMNRTGEGVVYYQRQSASNWSIGTGDAAGSTGSTGWGTEPTQTNVAYWLWVHDGTNINAYYNAPGNVSNNLTFFSLPASPTGDITFGNSVNSGVDPWPIGASAIYFANVALPTSILTTAANNNGIITSDANYGDVDCFLTVGASSVTDRKGNFGSAAINGTLTFTSK